MLITRKALFCFWDFAWNKSQFICLSVCLLVTCHLLGNVWSYRHKRYHFTWGLRELSIFSKGICKFFLLDYEHVGFQMYYPLVLFKTDPISDIERSMADGELKIYASKIWTFPKTIPLKHVENHNGESKKNLGFKIHPLTMSSKRK